MVGADIAAITHPVFIRILLIRIESSWAIVKLAGVFGEAGSAVSVTIGIGADVAAIANAVTVGIPLTRVVDGGAVIIRAGVFRLNPRLRNVL